MRAAALCDDFAAWWRTIGAPKRLLLAVSGGADSIALLHLAAALRPVAELRAATVDHGLRAGSADDARFAERSASALGVDAITLAWEGAKPSTGVQAAARAMRYRLLAQEAERWRADAILTGHTADDQAETTLMRIAHRSGARGLSGMAAETFIADGAGPPQRLLRPLLGVPRAALRAYLAEIGAAFVDDPSNDDPRFERVRARRALAAKGEAATAALLALGDDARRLSARLDRLDNARLDSIGASFRADGSVQISSNAIAPHIDGPLTARLISAVGSSEVPAAEASASALAAALVGRRTTLAGALVARAGALILISREPAALLGRAGEAAAARVSLAPGARCLWDQRFIVENTLGAAADIGPLGAASATLGVDHPEALAAAPGLWIGGTLVAFPGDDGEGETAFQTLAAERFHRLVVRHC